MDDKNRRNDIKEESDDVILGNEMTPESDAGQSHASHGSELPSVRSSMTEPEDETHEIEEEEKRDIGDELTKVQDIASQLENQLKRSLADYQNLQKRVQEEKVNWIRMANKDLLLKMLPVLDTLMLAHKHLADKGLELSIHQFLQVLKDEGVTKMETVGKEFDANTMEATGTTEGEEGKVVDEVRAGYVYYDMVLRPAQVIVGSK